MGQIHNLFRWVILITVTQWFLSKTIHAQEQVSPYNARAYFEAQQNITYVEILSKSNSGEILSREEEKFLREYTQYLESFYNSMSKEEKDKYLEFRTQWVEEFEDLQNQQDSDVLEENRLGIKPGKKFLLSNGLYGFAYGIGGAYILNIQESWAIALPFISAGFSLAYPLMNPKKYEGIDYSTVMLTRHGKFIGLLDGVALGFLLFGDPDNNDWAGRAIVATSMAGSIALGEVGFHIGKKKRFPEGKVATYKYYSLLVPYLAFSGLAAGNVDDPRIYGATILAAGAAGYFVGDRVYRKYKFTRGDMLAVSSFGLMSTALGFGLTPVNERWHLLVPALTALGGTITSHAILRNTKFTSKQGWNINYASLAGIVLGFGVAIAIQPESHNLYLILPAATGMLGWAIITSNYKKRQSPTSTSTSENKRWADLSFNLTPQNYFINKQIKPSANNPQRSALPMFSLKLKL
jgi:hypothetical protein